MDNHKNCPICYEEIFSEAGSRACNMCGMPVDVKKMLMINSSSKMYYFCNKDCYKKYFSIHKESLSEVK